ncbi:ubiquitin carboxyl-terminal hydrolase 36-like [Anopheles bellator]|uniref:ubiquitin carboxyl-terminal hydrolase 36-like n=1 Tax=Anopheles bellator TaxID=139047 RepID=UPI002649B93A|nr:ubiquitin carboxyl-terminal hydrolase 36-like [Anopheles bellator]
MCVGFAGDAVAAASDSDINYDDGNGGEWPGGGARGGPPLHSWPSPSSSFSSSSSGSVPAPDNLVRWKDLPHHQHHHHHGQARSRMHHVRHEQHYVQGRPAKGATRHPISDDPSMPMPMPTDTIRTTVHGPQQKSRHSNHNHRKHQKHHPKQSSESSEEASAGTKQVVQRFEVLDLGTTKEAHRGSRGSVSPVATNRKRSASTYHSVSPSPARNSLWAADEPARPSGTQPAAVGKTTRATKQYTLRSANPHSKNYFEELLNNYKSHSPLYKDHQPQTKALAQGPSREKPRPRTGAGLVAKAKAKTSDTTEYDYSYEDEQDDGGVQNDGTFGEAPPATTTKMPSTTQRAQEARGSVEEDSSGDGDSGYSAFYQKAYTMQKNPRRSGNNLYNSPRATVSNHQNQLRTHGNPVDPARQVSVPKPYSSMTELKQVNFGTKDAVDRIYSQYSGRTKDYMSHQAQLHFERIKVEGLCKVPRPKLVPASTNRSLDFRPDRTILHRCDDETGCCMPSETCVPKHTATVDLYFFVAPVRGRSHYQPRALTFVNHTECHCVQRGGGTSSSSQAASSPPSASGEPPKPPVVCRCPKHFKSIVDSESECYCDCLADNRDCIRFKEGLESFSMDDRRCILKRSCHAPLCRHGTFDRIAGKCPKKTDRMDQLFSAVYR